MQEMRKEKENERAKEVRKEKETAGERHMAASELPPVHEQSPREPETAGKQRDVLHSEA